MRLCLDNISKSYGKTKALCGFSIELEAGIYGLLGPNGSGKSTLINIITDNLKADSGRILFAEDEHSEAEDTLKMGGRFRSKLGYMPQYPGLYPNYTVERFMDYMALLKGVTKEQAQKQIPELLESVELLSERNRKIGAMSGGMKQRLCLAQAMLGDPSVIILDEPTAGLDPKQRIAIRNYISKIAFNKIVLIATHVVSDVEYTASKIIMLKKGKIVDCASPGELSKKITNKVWNVSCSEDEVSLLQNKYRVIGISKKDTGVVLRIISESSPCEMAVAVSPTLEDYYLWEFGD